MTARDRRPALRARIMWLLWRNGWSKASIARAYGISSQPVARILAQRGGVGDVIERWRRWNIYSGFYAVSV